jgi:hypothetical protein
MIERGPEPKEESLFKPNTPLSVVDKRHEKGLEAMSLNCLRLSLPLHLGAMRLFSLFPEMKITTIVAPGKHSLTEEVIGDQKARKRVELEPNEADGKCLQ